jgi:hypothetical protein
MKFADTPLVDKNIMDGFEGKVEQVPAEPSNATKSHSIPSGLLQAVLNYLQTKPFNEVADLIGAIMREAKQIQ